VIEFVANWPGLDYDPMIKLSLEDRKRWSKNSFPTSKELFFSLMALLGSL